MDRDPIEYTLKSQRIALIIASLGFFGISLIVSFLDPFNQANFWLFLFVLIAFLSSLISLLGFWWVFSIEKKILTILEVQKLLYHSFFASICLVSLLVFYITNNLNNITSLGVLVSYIFYRNWIK